MQANYHPVELIHMMYERVLVHLEHAVVAIEEDQPVGRAEHMNKAIAIVTELYVSVKPDESEASQFLLGMYEAILAELPKAGLTKDVENIRRAHRYLQRLKEVWEETAMRENGLVAHGHSGGVVSTEKEVEHVVVNERNVYSSSKQDSGVGQVSFSV